MVKNNIILKIWAKIELNSLYGFPPVSIIPMLYDKNKSNQITINAKNNLELITNYYEK